MASRNKPKDTFYLYSRRRDPVTPSVVRAQEWLLNNGATYTHSATVQAASAEEAYATLQEKRLGRGRNKRFASIHSSALFHALGPGDVLVDEQKAWIIGPDEQLDLIPYEPQQPRHSYAQGNQVQCVAWSVDGCALAASESSGQVHLYDLCTRETRSPSSSFAPSYKRHGTSTVYAVAWSPDDTRIASGGSDGEVHVWKPDLFGGYGGAARGSILVCRAFRRAEDTIGCLAWATDSRSVLAGRVDGSIVQWDTVTGAVLSEIHPHEGAVMDLARSPTDRFFASAGVDGCVRVWREGPWDTHVDQAMVSRAHTHEVLAVAWSPDGQLLAFGGKEDRHLHLWHPWTRTREERLPVSVSFAGPLSITCLGWSPDGQMIAVGCDDGTIQVLAVASKQHIRTYRTNNRDGVKTLAWSPNGQRIASAGYARWGNAHAIKVWSATPDPVAASMEESR